MENVAVVGASPKPDRYANKAMRMLAEYHHIPLPVSPVHSAIEGKPAVSSLKDIRDKVDTVTLYVGPARQAPVIDEIIETRPDRVIFNPGTENPAVYERLRSAGIEVTEACTLVLLKTGQY